MNIQINAKDSTGTDRCYGIGLTESHALTECEAACTEWLSFREHIPALYPYYQDTGKPVIDANTKAPMIITI